MFCENSIIHEHPLEQVFIQTYWHLGLLFVVTCYRRVVKILRVEIHVKPRFAVWRSVDLEA